MSQLVVFSSISVDGYFTDANGDMSWAHRSDPEWDDFVAGNARQDSTLLFGRVTYEQMASFWPTPQGRRMAPEVAKGMNQASKIVFSRSLDEATWSNTRLVRDDMPQAVRALKQTEGHDLVVLGSGSVVSQLAQADLVDEYRLVLVPVVLGAGRSLFDGLQERVGLQLVDTRRFKNGNVVLGYRRA
jgi:dihydrofolate reductase